MSTSSQVQFLLCSGSIDTTARMKTSLSVMAGWDVTVVGDAAVAIDYLEHHYPSVIIIDDTFATDGFAFCEQVRRMRGYTEQPVLLLVDEAGDATVSKIRRSGATEFCLRDTAESALLFRLEQMLRHANVRRDTYREIEALDNRHNDSLTGLLNRKHFKLKLEQNLIQSVSAGRQAAVMLIDVDDFKRINSSFDYQAGDYMLKVIARRMTSVLRDSDIIMRDAGRQQASQILGRIGGDEFTVFVEGVSELHDLNTIAGRILDAISAPVLIDGHEIVLTASAGVAIVGRDGSSVDMLLRNAEQAMYAAKVSSEDRLAFFNQEMESAARTRFLLETELRKGLDSGQFSLHYQPLIDAESGRITRMEALCRWYHPALGHVSPAEFIPVAEDSGMITTLGDWVLNETCRQIQQWRSEGLTCERVAVNVSTIQFSRTDFVERVQSVLNKYQLDGSCLELELTESVFMKNAKENIVKLNALKAIGVTLAVDDFGTGYSSLSYLKDLPIDTLKIERSFVASICHSAADLAIVEAILALASRLQLKVVAEGVEEPEQLENLQARGCDFFQGYLFSPGVPAEQAGRLLGQNLNWSKAS